MIKQNNNKTILKNKNIKHLIVLGSIILNTQFIFTQELVEVNSLNQLLELVKVKNHLIKNDVKQKKLAELTYKSSKFNLFNPKIPSSIQVIDNINQQVSFLPGQIFGLPEGTFKETTIGLRYSSTINFQPQLDLINLASLTQIKSAKINLQLVENQNKINELNLFEKTNTIYFNVLSLKNQIEILKENLKTSNEILRIIKNKFNEGISRKQEVNEAEVNLITIQDKIEQLELTKEIQEQALNLILENSSTFQLTENLWNYNQSKNKLTVENELFSENSKIQSAFLTQELKVLKFQNYPVLSFISSFNWQNLSNTYFFSQQSNWTNFNFVGLKLSYDLPTTVNKITGIYSKKLQLEIAKENEEYAKKENENRNQQLLLEYEKSMKQKENLIKISELKKDTFDKNFNQFKENILSLDKLLLAQNEYIISKLNVIQVLANVGFYSNKIEINNSIK